MLSLRMVQDHTYLTWSTYSNPSWDAHRFGQILLLLRNRAPNTIHSTPADRSMGPYPVSLLSQPMNQGGVSQTPVGSSSPCSSWPITIMHVWATNINAMSGVQRVVGCMIMHNLRLGRGGASPVNDGGGKDCRAALRPFYRRGGRATRGGGRELGGRGCGVMHGRIRMGGPGPDRWAASWPTAAQPRCARAARSCLNVWGPPDVWAPAGSGREMERRRVVAHGPARGKDGVGRSQRSRTVFDLLK
jgi:hypothetical protein